ncbi:MAG: ankyrin repeat domain-containing protein [Candidatus Babeliales bacterium]|nr:ankyrin repeat domain-containing protein [Candidatus Babeliales bacterium]
MKINQMLLIMGILVFCNSIKSAEPAGAIENGAIADENMSREKELQFLLNNIFHSKDIIALDIYLKQHPEAYERFPYLLKTLKVSIEAVNFPLFNYLLAKWPNSVNEATKGFLPIGTVIRARTKALYSSDSKVLLDNYYSSIISYHIYSKHDAEVLLTMFKLLVNHGANLEFMDLSSSNPAKDPGNNPLVYAASNGDYEIVKFLVSKRAGAKFVVNALDAARANIVNHPWDYNSAKNENLRKIVSFLEGYLKSRRENTIFKQVLRGKNITQDLGIASCVSEYIL